MWTSSQQKICTCDIPNDSHTVQEDQRIKCVKGFYSLANQRQKCTFLYQFNVKLCLDSQYLKKGASTLRQPLYISSVFVYIA